MGPMLATACIGVSSVGFGLVPLFARELLALGLSAEAVALYRYVLTLALVAPFFPKDRAKRKAMLLMVLAGFAMGLSWTGYVRAVDVAPVSVVGVIYMSYPLFVIPIAWALVRQPVEKRSVIAGLMVIAAAVMVLGPTGGSIALSESQLWALLLSLPAPIAFAFIIVALTTLCHALSPLERMAAGFTGTVGGLLPMALATNPEALIPAQDIGWAWIAAMALLTATIPQFIYTMAAPHVGASRTATVGAVEMPTMLLVSWVAFSEPLGPTEIAAAVLIVAAISFAPCRVAAPRPQSDQLPA